MLFLRSIVLRKHTDDNNCKGKAVREKSGAISYKYVSNITTKNDISVRKQIFSWVLPAKK